MQEQSQALGSISPLEVSSIGPPKRKLGRPKGSKDKPRDSNDPNKKPRGRPRGGKNPPRDPNDPKRGAGRPRKYPADMSDNEKRKIRAARKKADAAAQTTSKEQVATTSMANQIQHDALQEVVAQDVSGWTNLADTIDQHQPSSSHLSNTIRIPQVSSTLAEKVAEAPHQHDKDRVPLALGPEEPARMAREVIFNESMRQRLDHEHSELAMDIASRRAGVAWYGQPATGLSAPDMTPSQESTSALESYPAEFTGRPLLIDSRYCS
ncbi:hypothetical protein OIO90_001889 [Microbotryomycetes sp. JL221]|nr:hypothetical protein OIO90_001889 [Microbotryomycetes sp. JL221]